MGSKMLVDASHPEEIRVVVARGNRIEEFDFESASRKPLKGNIYLAKVTRVEPSLQAAFVEYGGNRHGFLAFAEIHPDYYQIPMADRLALIKEQEEDEAEEARHENEDDEGPHDDGGRDQGDVASAHQDDDHENAAEPSSQSNDETDDEIHPDDEVPPTMAMANEADDSISSEIIEPDDSEVPAESAAAEVETIDDESKSHSVESIGAEDAMEEVPQRRTPRRQPRRRYKIQEVIKRRQILLIQVVKEERGNKGAALTTYLSLAGRYCVLMPNTARGGGISRKITDAGDRRRLKEVARDVEVPKGMGLIVRTAGAQRTRPEIKRDFDYLFRLWESVRDLTLKSQAPCLVYEEGSLIKRSIRDLYTKDVDEVIVEGEDVYREAKDFMKMLMPSHAKNVKLYKDPRPLFSRHQIETHLDGLLAPNVTLPSGGYIVINQTEALVSIDINSGKATREHNIEDTAVKTNLEACDEIGRQLRLRDLAGLIVIDFIDMEENRNNRAVERRIKDALKNDRARIQVGRISHFGLLEMSRQRLRPGLLEGTYKPCPHCEGRGIVRSLSSCGLGVLRSIEEHLLKRAENLTVKCARDVAFYLLNEKRDNLLAMEQAHGITIFVVPGDEHMRGTQIHIEKAIDRDIAPRRIPVSAPVQMDSAFEDEEEIVESEEAEETAEGEEAAAGSAESEGQREGGRRRRRRGRRGGRGGRDENRAEGDETPEAISADQDDERPDSTVTEHAVETIDGEAAEDGGEPRNAENGEGEGRRERNGRRGRFGRGRGRGRDRGPREERDAAPVVSGDGEAIETPPTAEAAIENNDAPAEQSERPKRERGGRQRGNREDRPRRNREDRPPRENAAEPVFTAPPPQPAIIIPDYIPEPVVRKWQPPAPTVEVATVTPKKGWWSKKS